MYHTTREKMEKTAQYTTKMKKTGALIPIGINDQKSDQYDQPDQHRITSVPTDETTSASSPPIPTTGNGNKIILHNMGVVHG
jgi:hypothetical protein